MWLTMGSPRSCFAPQRVQKIVLYWTYRVWCACNSCDFGEILGRWGGRLDCKIIPKEPTFFNNDLFFVKFEWNLYEKVVIFSTFVVEKRIFVIKMYSFKKIMLYFLTWTYQRGALISLHICKHNSAFKRNKRHETRNRKYGFGVFGVYSKSLSFQLVNYCRPQLEGDFPFMGVARLLAATKKDRLSSRSFLYLEKGWKKAQPFGWAFYTPKRFRTAVAGMKIPSPGPLDDRGVLCGDKYRIL